MYFMIKYFSYIKEQLKTVLQNKLKQWCYISKSISVSHLSHYSQSCITSNTICRIWNVLKSWNTLQSEPRVWAPHAWHSWSVWVHTSHASSQQARRDAWQSYQVTAINPPTSARAALTLTPENPQTDLRLKASALPQHNQRVSLFHSTTSERTVWNQTFNMRQSGLTPRLAPYLLSASTLRDASFQLLLCRNECILVSLMSW